mmetsp:Transcript_8689/g.27976  ORF Transcript_8689/g.27976 Transcript_8689/m.27976 type:complete len:293 (+) Transcript_8689:126-1004(+)
MPRGAGASIRGSVPWQSTTSSPGAPQSEPASCSKGAAVAAARAVVGLTLAFGKGGASALPGWVGGGRRASFGVASSICRKPSSLLGTKSGAAAPPSTSAASAPSNACSTPVASNSTLAAWTAGAAPAGMMPRRSSLDASSRVPCNSSAATRARRDARAAAAAERASAACIVSSMRCTKESASHRAAASSASTWYALAASSARSSFASHLDSSASAAAYSASVPPPHSTASHNRRSGGVGSAVAKRHRNHWEDTISRGSSMLSRWECSSGSAAATTVPNAAVSILSPAMVCVW